MEAVVAVVAVVVIVVVVIVGVGVGVVAVVVTAAVVVVVAVVGVFVVSGKDSIGAVVRLSAVFLSTVSISTASTPAAFLSVFSPSAAFFSVLLFLSYPLTCSVKLQLPADTLRLVPAWWSSVPTVSQRSSVTARIRSQ